jgi:hypothetical protein
MSILVEGRSRGVTKLFTKIDFDIKKERSGLRNKEKDGK